MILSFNCGSSSIKFAIHSFNKVVEQKLVGQIGGLNSSKVLLSCKKDHQAIETILLPQIVDHSQAAHFLLQWIEAHVDVTLVQAVCHRIVNGRQYENPQLITQKLLQELKESMPYDLERLPDVFLMIDLFSNKCPNIMQFACFDTAFHKSLPRKAKILPLPRRYDKQGIQRYGFHGLSYDYLLRTINSLDSNSNKARIIMAHLGNGASLAAILNNECIDTSMSFTPTSGIPMSCRSGDLDPGVVHYIMKQEGLSVDQFYKIASQESGLLGISESDSDINNLLQIEHNDNRAHEAVEVFCYHIKKQIGAFASALGGIDAIVFSGGIGEHMPAVRKRICDGLAFLDIDIDNRKNQNNNIIISNGRVIVYVIHTDEELMMAQITNECLKTQYKL